MRSFPSLLISLPALWSVALGNDLRWWHYDGHDSIAPGKAPHGTSVAFEDHVLVDGWGKLHVEADASDEGAYAAGFVEGYLTAVHIFEHYISWLQAQFGRETVHAGGQLSNAFAFAGQGRAVRKFIEENDMWVRRKVRENLGSTYWQAVGRLMSQVDGMLAGQNAATRNVTTMKLGRVDLLLLLASGDAYDIAPAVHEDGLVNWAALNTERFMREFHRRVSCSALITYTPDAIRAGHTTWTSYNNMLRIYKTFTWKVHGQPVHKVSFSSRPGYMYSKDDFYTLPLQQLIVMETTNGIFNNSLYRLVTPKALLAWQRVPVANFLAKDGASWAAMMAQYNSGTYNNQWIVVTLDRASAGGLRDGFVYIAEQIPGQVAINDVTPVVRRQGFWSSYNIPFDNEIYEKSGYPAQVAKMGDENSYTKCARAKIFQRDAPGARDSLEAFKRVLGSNNFQTDPLSKGDATRAISARGDLNEKRPDLYGAVDLKVTEAITGAEWDGSALARSGPTTDGQKPFSWLSLPDAEPVLHLGQPSTFDFPFVRMSFGAGAATSKRAHVRTAVEMEAVSLDSVAATQFSRLEMFAVAMITAVVASATTLAFASKSRRLSPSSVEDARYYLHR
eukprot:TRINITY_DN23736_c0_g2_i2.p1 TRINITY_DN23736_c0_g2~~TRINITY_DN23736_c0_g2_i2.p1  ORF type:complete len:617 (+),score=66.67 TRINITY_DN23736_c0_g2_i2:25-1875(+)